MDWAIIWHKPSPLHKCSGHAIYEVDFSRVPDEAGIYIFLRSHGQSERALYVGKAVQLRARVKNQLNNLKLMKGIEDSPHGAKLLVFGVLQRKRGPAAVGALEAIERGLIQHYLSLGRDILNVAGTSIARHSLTSERPALKRFTPREIAFEKQPLKRSRDASRKAD